MPLQECLLRGPKKRAMKGSCAGHAPHAENLQGLSLASQIRLRFVPVHLRLNPKGIGLRNESFSRQQTELFLLVLNIAPHRGLGNLAARQLL